MKRVYLDNNSTTAIDPRVAEAMERYIVGTYGNPSNLHSFGRECAEGLADSREKVARFLHCDPQEVYFTGSGTESDNWAVKGTAYAARASRRHVISSPIEHGAVLASCRFLEAEGFRVTYLPVDGSGLVDPEQVRAAITDETALVTVMLVNNEIGTIEPVREIAAICRERGVCCHTDAVAAAGKTSLDVGELGVDLLTISGHKLHAAKGVGVLYVREGTRIEPLIHGGHQERGMRAGTENVIGIAGMARACELLAEEWRRDAEHIRRLRDRLERGIRERVPEVRFNGHPERRAVNVCHVCIGYVEGEALLLNLDLEGIAVASGSACSSGEEGVSPTLAAIGVPPLFANSPLRFSLGRENTEEEIDYALDALVRVVERLRSISPIWHRRD